MVIKFHLIKAEYDKFYKNMMGKGSLLMKDTPVGFWGPTSTEEAFTAFKRLNLGRFKSFLDIGSGDGKIVLIASLFCNNAVGIEYDPILVGKALEIRRKLGLLNTQFVNDDFFNHDFSGYDMLFCNPDKPMYRGLEEKLLKEMNGKLILHGHHFHPTNLKKEKEFSINNTLFTVYTK